MRKSTYKIFIVSRHPIKKNNVYWNALLLVAENKVNKTNKIKNKIVEVK